MSSTSTVQLKKFQTEALEDFQAFIDQWAELGSISDAFREATDRDYRTPSWDAADKELRRWVPSICLQAGTGGGKTLMATTWLEPIAGSVAGGPLPLRLVLWLVPTKTLIEQTTRILRDRKGMYRPILEAAFGSLEVVSRDTFLSIAPAQLSNGLTIVVSTAQGFRREDVEGLRAFRENGSLMSHFADETDDPLLGEDGKVLPAGQVVPSAINVVRRQRPVVVVDEAHRNQSALSWQMLSALRPRFVLELTATPREGANVLHSVPPIRLKAEEMIRMPVNLFRCEGWMDALADARKSREKQEKAAARAGDRIRPIVLIQAEAKDDAHSHLDKGKVAVFDVISFLTEELGIAREQIAVRTGDVDELSGRDLLAADCPIRYVVTVQAAAEGWDCPFATTLAAMSTSRSRLQVTQVLGRCVRQDLARRSSASILNETYAFASTPAFAETATAVIGSMEELGFHGSDVKIHENGKTRGGTSNETTTVRPMFATEKIVSLALRPKPRARAILLSAPEELAPFAAKKLRLDRVDQIVKPTEPMDAAQIDFDVDGKLVQTELNLPAAPQNDYQEFDQDILIDALSRAVRHRGIRHEDMARVIRATVTSLAHDGWTLSELFGNFRMLASAVAVEMKLRYADVLQSGLDATAQNGKLVTTETVLPSEVIQVGVSAPGLDLSRHAYDAISKLNTDEMKVAQDLAASKKVRWWWRNPDRTGWFLVGRWGRFYPDFLARLKDGRLIVIEYKGAQLVGNVDTDLKEDLGQLWASKVGPKAAFFLVTKSPDAKRPAQISPNDLARNVLGIAA